MGYVVERDGRFYAVLYDGIDPITGRERRRWPAAGSSRADAERIAATIERERRVGEEAGASVAGVMVARFLTADWLPGKRMTVRATTYRRYEWMVEHYVIPAIGAVPLRRLRSDHLEGLYAELLTTKGRTGDGLSPKTVLEVHALIRAALRGAVRRRLLGVNVADAADAPRIRTIGRPRMRSWTAEQLTAFLSEASGQRLFPALYLAATTGMRRGEILGLRWADIDVDAKRLSVSRTLQLVGTRPVEGPVKTRGSRRSIDLDANTVAVLATWRGRQTDRGTSTTSDGWVFTAVGGGPVNPDLLSQTFERIVTRSGLPRIRFHDLRHTHASLLVKDGVPLKVVSERLGHASAAFTMVTYQHVLPGMQADAAARFAQLIGSSPDGR